MIHHSNHATCVPQVASVCSISLLYELGHTSGFEIHTGHYGGALSGASCFALLYSQAALTVLT